jgi:hypothetical protein
VPSVLHRGEVPITIPVAISTNHTQHTSWPSYCVDVQWHADSYIADMIKCNTVVTKDLTAWNKRLEVVREQLSKPKHFTLHDTPELSILVDLEEAVTQFIQDICTQLSTSHAAVVAMIHVQGPVHIPSDFTIIEMPAVDKMPLSRFNAVTRTVASASAASAILYVATQRPDAAALSSLVSSTTLATPVPIAVAYCPTDNSVDNDLQAVQDAMHDAVDTYIRESTVHAEFDSAKVSACISNTVLVDSRRIASDRTACYEQIRHAATNDKLVQWSTLLNRFGELVRALQLDTALASTAAATLDKLLSRIGSVAVAIQPFLESMHDISKRTAAESRLLNTAKTQQLQDTAGQGKKHLQHCTRYIHVHICSRIQHANVMYL